MSAITLKGQKQKVNYLQEAVAPQLEQKCSSPPIQFRKEQPDIYYTHVDVYFLRPLHYPPTPYWFYTNPRNN